MVRFSPHETGRWTYTVKARDNNGETTSETFAFYVRDSNLNGPIQVSANKRYLQHPNGKPYYGIGLWYNDG